MRTLLVVASALASMLAATAPLIAQAERLVAVDVFMNGRYLLRAHVHVSNSRTLGVAQGCVEHRELERLLGGTKYLELRRTNLDAVALGNDRTESVWVQRRGRISTRVHRVNGEAHFPLEDLVRAIGAKVAHVTTERIDLVLDRPDPRAILAWSSKRGEDVPR